MSEQTKNTWTINALLAVILALLTAYYFRSSETPAYAAGGGWDTDGIMAVSAADTERIVLVDTKNKTVMIYKTLGNAFRLVGSRSYEYDMEVEDSAGTVIEKGQGRTWMNMFEDYNAAKK